MSSLIEYESLEDFHKRMAKNEITKDNIGFLTTFKQGKEYFTRLLMGNFLLFLEFFIIKFLLNLKSGEAGISTINFYRGVIYIFISYLHIRLSNFDFKNKDNYRNRYFFKLVLRSFIENMLYLFILLSMNSLKLVVFTDLFCVFIYTKIIINNYQDQGRISPYNIIYIIVIFFSVLLHLTPLTDDKIILYDLLAISYGYIYFIMSVVCFILLYLIDKYIKVHFYLCKMGSGLFSMIFAPLFISITREENKMNIYTILIVIFICICGFYTEYIFSKLHSQYEHVLPNNVKTTKNLMFGLLIILTHIANYVFSKSIESTDLLGSIGVLMVFVFKSILQ